ncbi:hypothetical protein O6H91_17G015900 [Diphasiastrum complanatum]|uniref:Uncharacterized protein n=1 Tax=Diphasiastrum complanatum TaxID=34168 RepID=A0ACC2B5K8_DIPCM|nr:hypothetical protein O6H91_17G015900 [Diphasiastrum complanatum]
MSGVFDRYGLSATSSFSRFSDDTLLLNNKGAQSRDSSHSANSTSPTSVLEVAQLQDQRRSCSDLNADSVLSIALELSPQSEGNGLVFPPSTSQSSPAYNIDDRSHKCSASIEGHTTRVCSLAVGGDLLYSGSDASSIRIWRRSEMDAFSSFRTGDGAVKALLVHGDKVFSAHQDHKIRVWRHSKSRPSDVNAVATLPTLKNYLTSFLSPKNYVQVRRHHKRLWIEHVDAVSVLAVGNGVLYSGSWDKTVKVWRLSDYRCLETVEAHDDAVNALIVGSNGRVYTGSADKKVKSWYKSSKTHVLLSTMEGHKSGVNALALSTDESLLYSGSSDTSIVVWEKQADEDELKNVESLRGHRAAVLCLAAIVNGLCSGSADKTIRIWERKGGRVHECLSVLEGHVGGVSSLSVGMVLERGGCLSIYSGSVDGCLKLWCIPLKTEASSSDFEDIQTKLPLPNKTLQ